MKEKRREEKYYTLANFLSFKLFIALLSLILFFSISCKSNEEPTETPPAEPTEPTKPPTPTTKHELEGTWVGYDKEDNNYKLEFKVDSEGNINFSPQPALDYDNSLYSYTYKGKIVVSNTYDYPFTVNLSNRVVAAMDEPEGIFTFTNSSNCNASYTKILWFSSSGAGVTNIIIDFTKQ